MADDLSVDEGVVEAPSAPDPKGAPSTRPAGPPRSELGKAPAAVSRLIWPRRLPGERLEAWAGRAQRESGTDALEHERLCDLAERAWHDHQAEQERRAWAAFVVRR